MTDPVVPKPVPTQVVYPWQATLRTIVAMLFGIVVAMIFILPIGLDVFGQYMNDQVRERILYVLGILVAVSAFVTRVMAVPAVNALLGKLGLGAQK